MELRLYCIWDRLAKESGPIFQGKNDLVAIRSFRIATKEINAAEVCLYYVGEYDTEKAAIVGLKSGPIEVVIPDERKEN